MYDITFNTSPVGTAQMEKQGLYYLFSCRCSLPDEGLYRIHVVYGDKREDLGICVPMDGVFGMDKKISAKKLGEGTPSFELLPRDWQPPQVDEEPPVKEGVKEETPAEETSVEGKNSPPEAEETAAIAETAEPIFLPVSEEEPFDHLDKLENAVMAVRDDQIGIVIPETE